MATDEATSSQNQELRFRPSAEAAAALLHAATPAPMVSAHGFLPVVPQQALFDSKRDSSSAPAAEVIQSSIGERIERLLATIGFDGVDRGIKQIVIARGQELLPPFHDLFLNRLQLGPGNLDVLGLIVRDLHAAVRETPIRGDWGVVTERENQIVLLPASALPGQDATPGPRAQVVGRTMIG